jgi:hypothetical protein
MSTVDPLEAVTRRPAVGEGREDQNARHEAESSGRQGVFGLKRKDVL